MKSGQGLTPDPPISMFTVAYVQTDTLLGTILAILSCPVLQPVRWLNVHLQCETRHMSATALAGSDNNDVGR